MTRKVKRLLRNHEITRLLIKDLESRHIQLLHRIRALEQVNEKKELA